MDADDPCVFCEIFTGREPAEIVQSSLGGTYPMLAIRPLKPVTPGHVLVIPGRHVPDFTSEPHVTAVTMAYAAYLGQGIAGDTNLITSRGPDATQTVFHLHVHLIPRTVGDGLALPWSPGKATA